ncbi:MAG: hypothetical protein ACI93R_000147 [Flavobacteriales bacterium]|jgi:hypothetical protein
MRLMLGGAVMALASSGAYAVDDGSQMNNRFRVNYAGYLPQAAKTGIYISDQQGAINWQLQGSDCAGSETTHVSNDKSSGDSFYIIDFSECTDVGSGFRLAVGGDQSEAFDISDDPYGDLKYEFFDYFKDHEAFATFSNAKNNWDSGLNISFNYVKDAGDNGAYPTNTAEASWALINMLEAYPDINTYYSANFSGAKTVYSQLNTLTDQFNHTMSNGRNLAIAKFHTNVNSTWAACSPHNSGTCIAEPETKATFATARSLASMARLHSDHGSSNDASGAYDLAKTALNNARSQPFTCNQSNAFGGEGGMYPDNDNLSLFRDPKSDRDNCIADRNNTEDDEYVALVELYIAAEKLGNAADTASFKSEVMSHSRFNEASSYWWGAVVMEGGLSLLANEAIHSIDLSALKANILNKADEIANQQDQGYPGVTWDPDSNQWDAGDQDHIDNNVRWGSHRMALNDARIMMAAAEIAKNQGDGVEAARFARGVVKVLDHISGVNAVNLAMFTAGGYNHIENAVTRTHDGANASDSWAGKMVLGPNNWTNADDGDMPAFGSQPGLKMFSLNGTGWASREISIDANASLVPVAYFAMEVAPSLMMLDPIGGTPETQVPAAPSNVSAVAASAGSVALNWLDNAGSNSDSEQGFNVYVSTSNNKPATPTANVGTDVESFLVSALNPETNYFFWVEAFNVIGRSAALTALATTPGGPAFVNSLSNGDFDQGNSAWDCTAPGGSVSCAVEAGVYHVAISDGGSEAWHIQPLQTSVALVQGNTYTFAFDARASSNRNAEIKIERDGSPWDDFSQAGSGQSLTNTMQRFSYTFTASDTLGDARVVMNLGGNNSDVFVDNIWLVEGSADPCNGVAGCVVVEQHEISVSAGSNGGISPSTLQINEGASQTFNITASDGFEIADVIRNGVSVGAVSSVTFNNVTADQTLSASFSAIIVVDTDGDGIPDSQDQCPGTPAATVVDSVGCAIPNTPMPLQAEDYNRFFDTSAGNEGGQYRDNDVDIEAVSDAGGGFNVGWTAAGEWLAYDISLPVGTYDVLVRVASMNGGAVSASVSGSAASANVSPTGGWQSWQTLNLGQVDVTAATTEVRVDITGGGINLNWVELQSNCNGAAHCTDSDGDGVFNDADLCPNTPFGVAVTANGCSIIEPDTDGDGVVDSQDFCPNTPNGTVVNSDGCPIIEPDTDGDGVIDSQDLCPNTPNGTVVNSDGCPVVEPDTDGDGIPDSQDQCPNTTPGAIVDALGCEMNQTEMPLQGEDYDRFMDLTPGNDGGQYRNDNVDIEATSDADGGFNVGWTDTGEWLAYDINLAAGTYDVRIRVASMNGGAVSATVVDANTSEETVSANVSPTGGWQTWETINLGQVTINSATNEVRVDIDGGGINLNWLDLKLSCSSSPSCSDNDGDGVPDGLDLCPNTVVNANVDGDGCEIVNRNGIRATVAAAQMGKGFNLGQMFDNEQHSRTFDAARSKIDAYYAEGFRNVRIPITWTDTIGGSTLVNDVNVGDVNRSHARLAVITQVIDYALSLQGMYIVINAHHEGELKEQNRSHVLERLWDDISDIYVDRDYRLMYEILNEPHLADGSAMDAGNLRNMTGKAYTKIRANDPERTVIIGGNQWFGAHEMALTWPHLNDVGGGQDDFIMSTFHHYNPWEFNGKSNHDIVWSDSDVFSPMDTMANWANGVGNGMPVYIGEWGTNWGEAKGSMECNNIRLFYQKMDAEYASAKGQPTAVWDDGGWFKIFDHGTNSFNNNLFQCIDGVCDWSGDFTRVNGACK